MTGRIACDYAVRELRPTRIETLLKTTQLLQNTLRMPIGSHPFDTVFMGASNLVIVLPTQHWGGNLQTALDALLIALSRLQIPDNEITILLANSTSKPLAAIALKKLLGGSILQTRKVVQHDCLAGSDMEFAGKGTNGTTIFLNRLLLEADEIILFSPITYNAAMGYSGGPELIIPGCASHDTIQAVQNSIFKVGTREIHSGCRDGVTSGNPLHACLKETFAKIPVKFGIYPILNQANKIVAIRSGHPLQAFLACRSIVDAVNGIVISRQADMTIVGCGGSPNDSTFKHAMTALHRAAYATKPGGIIILVAACKKGIGSSGIPSLLHNKAISRKIGYKKRESVIDMFGSQSLKIYTSTFIIYCISAMETQAINKMGLRPVSSLQDALDEAQKKLHPESLAYIISDGTVTVPRLVKMSQPHLNTAVP